MDVDPQTVKYGFDALRAAVETLKLVRDAMKSDNKSVGSTKIDEQIKAAEREVQFAEAQLAQLLEYRLCRAHFPPVAMLKDRVDGKYIVEIHKCPSCGREDPSPEFFAGEERKAERWQATLARHRNRYA